MLKDCQVNVHERGIDLAALDQFNKLPNTYFLYHSSRVALNAVLGLQVVESATIGQSKPRR